MLEQWKGFLQKTASGCCLVPHIPCHFVLSSFSTCYNWYFTGRSPLKGLAEEICPEESAEKDSIWIAKLTESWCNHFENVSEATWESEWRWGEWKEKRKQGKHLREAKLNYLESKNYGEEEGWRRPFSSCQYEGQGSSQRIFLPETLEHLLKVSYEKSL